MDHTALIARARYLLSLTSNSQSDARTSLLLLTPFILDEFEKLAAVKPRTPGTVERCVCCAIDAESVRAHGCSQQPGPCPLQSIWPAPKCGENPVYVGGNSMETDGA